MTLRHRADTRTRKPREYAATFHRNHSLKAKLTLSVSFGREMGFRVPVLKKPFRILTHLLVNGLGIIQASACPMTPALWHSTRHLRLFHRAGDVVRY